MKCWIMLASVAAVLMGCTSSDDRIAFEGEFYRAKLKKVDRQLDVFTVAVQPVSKSLTGAVQAGEYEAVAYCVNTFGSSDIAWTVGPDTPEGQLPIDGDTLLMQGQCPGSR